MDAGDASVRDGGGGRGSRICSDDNGGEDVGVQTMFIWVKVYVLADSVGGNCGMQVK